MSDDPEVKFQITLMANDSLLRTAAHPCGAREIGALR